MQVTTWTLEMRHRPDAPAPSMPDGVSLERAAGIDPEYARFLYGLVGGPWRWVDRLGWTRQQWSDELDDPGTEFWIAYGDGVPLGFVQLRPLVVDGSTHVEIRYFGLAERAIGKGLGGRMLARSIELAWSLPSRAAMPDPARVWVHTCSLDGPAALANYRARGLEVCDTVESDEPVPDRPLGSWVSTGGPVR